MALAPVDIYNLALSNLGISQVIADPNERTKYAIVCNRWYETCRDIVLADHPWRFATKAVSLAVVDETFPGWDYVYAYPDDCLAMRTITDDAGGRFIQNNFWLDLTSSSLTAVRMPFTRALKSDGNTQVILTDLPNAWGIYTARVTTPAVWSPQFLEALAWKLASVAGPSLQVEADMIQTAINAYLAFKNNAAALDMNEERPDREQESPSISIRN